MVRAIRYMYVCMEDVLNMAFYLLLATKNHFNDGYICIIESNYDLIRLHM